MNATGEQLSLRHSFRKFHGLEAHVFTHFQDAWRWFRHRRMRRRTEANSNSTNGGRRAARYFPLKRKGVPQGCSSGNYAKVIKRGTPAANVFGQPRPLGRNCMRERPQQEPASVRRAALPVLVLVALGWVVASILPVPDAEARGPGSWQTYPTWRVKGGSPAARFYPLKRQRVPKSSYYQTGIGEKAIKGGSPATSVSRH
jgi:hypothetical protein